MFKRPLLILAAAACLAAPLANAGDRWHGTPRAQATRVRVVHVEPVVQHWRHREPVRECRHGRCRTHTHTYYDQHVVGYRVAWVHRGQQGIVQLPYRPGPYITVSFGLR